MLCGAAQKRFVCLDASFVFLGLTVCGAASEDIEARVVGPGETVFDWTMDRCENGDIPDLA